MELRSNTSNRSLHTKSACLEAGSVAHRHHDSVLNAVKAIEGLEVNGNETRPVNGIQQPRLLDSKSTHSSTNPSQPWSTPPVAPRRSPCRRHSRSGSCLDLRHIPVDHKYLLRSFMSPDPSDRIEHWARSKEQQSIFALHGVDETRVQGGHKVAQNTNPQATQEDTKQDHRFSLPMVGEQLVYHHGPSSAHC